jgi:Rrf2 family protein
MHVPAKVEYAIQAAAELAAAHPGLVKGRADRQRQQIPPMYLQNILTQLRNAGLVKSHRGGTEGGYRLARPADQITLANIIRAVDGPLTTVRGARPQSLHYPDPASHLPKVWIAVRVSLRSVLEQVTLADLVAGTLPRSVCDLTDDPDAWNSHYYRLRRLSRPHSFNDAVNGLPCSTWPWPRLHVGNYMGVSSA